MVIQIISSAFEEGGIIPKQYTCDGENISPLLKWSSVPEGTKTITLICDDPDAPAGTWVHWGIFNIPAEIMEIKEKISTEKELPNGTKQGINDFGKIGYGGPCPPPGAAHRYFFKVYALDMVIDLNPGATKSELVKAMEGHILSEGKLMGKYSR